MYVVSDSEECFYNGAQAEVLVCFGASRAAEKPVPPVPTFLQLETGCGGPGFSSMPPRRAPGRRKGGGAGARNVDMSKVMLRVQDEEREDAEKAAVAAARTLI